jgi:hypothetical protein
MLVEDYIRPAAMQAKVITVKDGVTYDQEGEVVKRFGFHVLGRHGIATMLMYEQETPAVLQAIVRHSRIGMMLYYSHSQQNAKRAVRRKVIEHLIPAGSQRTAIPVAISDGAASADPVVRELVC